MWSTRRLRAADIIKKICDDFSYPLDFPLDVQQEMLHAPHEIQPKDLQGREDLRTLAFVTIDGEDAKDFDDAVYCVPMAQGHFRLYVAIADVSHYVRPQTPVDLEALTRGNSVYFPGKVIPMLPEALSNELCSLKPLVDRLVMVSELEINAEGLVQRFVFYPAVIHSQARLTYTGVAHFLTGTGEFNIPTHLHEPLLHLEQLYHRLKAQRLARGALDFDTVETQIQFDDQGLVAALNPYTRNMAHQIIEECMLAANVAAAEFLHQQEEAGVFRIHETPDTEKLEHLRQFLALHQVPWPAAGFKKITPQLLSSLVEAARDKIPHQLLQTMVLRSLQQARYSPDNVGHFGLAYDLYTHFTSPIRRYSDLLVHRMIKARLHHQPYHSAQKLDEVCAHLGHTERQADEASRHVISILKCDYATQFLGKTFDGIIGGVTRFGFFVQLTDLAVDGLVHVSHLHDDYYRFDEARQVLYGELTLKTFVLGQQVRVMLVRIDALGGKIDLDLLWAAPVQIASIPLQSGEQPTKKSKTSAQERPAKKSKKKKTKDSKRKKRKNKEDL